MVRATAVLLGALIGVSSILAQDTTSSTVTAIRDPQGISLLNQSLTVATGMMGLSTYQDFTATGTITYFWGGENVAGSATVRGRGPDQFRIDATLPIGTRSWAVSHGIGALRDTDGTLTPLAYHNTANIGVLAFPYPTIALALNDPSYSIVSLGPGMLEGRSVNLVSVTRNFSTQDDPVGLMSKLCVTVYFLDAQSNLVLKTQDTTHLPNDLGKNFKHEIELGNYENFGGYQVPTLVREKIEGQTIWEMNLSKFAFNTGLTDLDFTL